MNRRRKRQEWTIGAIVQVGWLTLKVKAIVPPPANHHPMAWLLTSLDGSRDYRFTPYNGLERIPQTAVICGLCEREWDADLLSPQGPCPFCGFHDEHGEENIIRTETPRGARGL